MAPRRAGLGLAVVFSALVALTIVIHFCADPFPGDFLIYRYGVLGADAGHDIYAHAIGGPGLARPQPFTYPPFALIALAPTTWFGWHTAWRLWCSASMVVLGIVLARMVPQHTPARPLLIALAIGATSGTCIATHNVTEGQINILLMGLCLADALRPDSPAVPRGALVGLATAVKVTPGLFILYFVATGQWRLARTATITAAGATLLGVLAHPLAGAAFFRSALWSLQDRVNTVGDVGYVGNNTINGALHALGGSAAALALPVMVLAGLGGVLAARHVHRLGQPLDAWLIVGLTAPVVSPFSWIHHLVYVLPALVRVALGPMDSPRLGAARSAFVMAALVSLYENPALGQQWLDLGNPWLVLPGLLQRESTVLVSIGCVLALVRQNQPGARRRDPARRLVLGDAGRPAAAAAGRADARGDVDAYRSGAW